MKVTNCYLGFVDAANTTRENPPLGWKIISFCLGSGLVHCYMAYKFDDRSITVLQTSETFFEEITLTERTKDTPCYFYEIKGDIEAAYRYSKMSIGKFYDYTGVIPLGIAGLAQRLINLILKPFNWLLKHLGSEDVEDVQLVVMNSAFDIKDAFYCVEACLGAMKETGVVFPQWWENAEISPPMLDRWMRDQGYLKTLI